MWATLLLQKEHQMLFCGALTQRSSACNGGGSREHANPTGRRQAGRQAGRQGRQAGKQSIKQTKRPTNKKINKSEIKQTNKYTNKPQYKHANKQNALTCVCM